MLKDINNAEDPLTRLEAERFWACFMFLFIMPPKHRDARGHSTWRTRTWASQPYSPLCRYDEFVVSHSTCCEHHTNYFSYYHRNVLSKYQLALNEADYALRNASSSQEMSLIRHEARNRRLEADLDRAIEYYRDLINRL